MKSALILPFNPGTSGVCNPAGTPGVTGIAGRAGIFEQSPRKMKVPAEGVPTQHPGISPGRSRATILVVKTKG